MPLKIINTVKRDYAPQEPSSYLLFFAEGVRDHMPLRDYLEGTVRIGWDRGQQAISINIKLKGEEEGPTLDTVAYIAPYQIQQVPSARKLAKDFITRIFTTLIIR